MATILTTSDISRSFESETRASTSKFLLASVTPDATKSGEPTQTPILVTQTAFETASASSFLQPTPTSQAQTQSSAGLSTGAVAGLSLSVGLLVGLIAATMLVLYRRWRSRPRNPHVNTRGVDAEALLGSSVHEEKAPMYGGPAPQPPPYARIAEWVQRTRATSFSSGKMSFWAPTINVSDEDSGTTTVGIARSQSNASSRSAYSQASAFRWRREEDLESGEPSRPLSKINE